MGFLWPRFCRQWRDRGRDSRSSLSRSDRSLWDGRDQPPDCRVEGHLMLRRHGANSQDSQAWWEFLSFSSECHRPRIFPSASQRCLSFSAQRNPARSLILPRCTTFASKSRSLAIDFDVMRQSASWFRVSRFRVVTVSMGPANSLAFARRSFV